MPKRWTIATLALALGSCLGLAACASTDSEPPEEDTESADFAVGDPTGCGEAYYSCLGRRCNESSEFFAEMMDAGFVAGCADCDQGTFCFQLY